MLPSASFAKIKLQPWYLLPAACLSQCNGFLKKKKKKKNEKILPDTVGKMLVFWYRQRLLEKNHNFKTLLDFGKLHKSYDIICTCLFCDRRSD